MDDQLAPLVAAGVQRDLLALVEHPHLAWRWPAAMTVLRTSAGGTE